MKPIENSSERFESDIFEALRFCAFHFPETEEEIENYVKGFGETKVELPESLSNPKELYQSIIGSVKANDENVNHYAMAAQGQNASSLPEDIQQKVKKDAISGTDISRKSSRGKKKN